jgi:hypothetical protein
MGHIHPNTILPNSVKQQLIFPYLYGKYDDSSIRHHIEEQCHCLIFMWGVGIKCALCHDTATGLVQHQNVDAPSLVLLIIFQDLASYIYIKFLSLQFISITGRDVTSNSHLPLKDNDHHHHQSEHQKPPYIRQLHGSALSNKLNEVCSILFYSIKKPDGLSVRHQHTAPNTLFASFKPQLQQSQNSVNIQKSMSI